MGFFTLGFLLIGKPFVVVIQVTIKRADLVIMH
ncbi:Uncharacterised protein [Vibrio cholerae]|nr:Uncharacterised protein [Vibrio cholerae]